MMDEIAYRNNPMNERSDASSNPEHRSLNWPRMTSVIVLVMAVLLIFVPILNNGFSTFDDPDMVEKNPYIKSLAPAAVYRMFTNYWVKSYYPVRLLSLAIDYHFWKLNPRGYHLTSLVLHTSNALLFFLLFLRLGDAVETARGAPSRKDGSVNDFAGWARYGAALAAALIFALHPLDVEPVAWIPGREELLMVLFCLGSLHSTMSARQAAEANAPRRRVNGLRAAAILLFAMACMSNALAIAFPAIIVAYDWLFVRVRRLKSLAAASAPFWAISIVALLLKLVGEKRVMAKFYGMNEVTDLTFTQRVGVICNDYMLNLRNIFWPKGLILSYNNELPESLLKPGVLLGLVLILVTLASLWALRRSRLAQFGLLWFLIALSPSAQILPHQNYRADRFLYFPLAGLALTAGAGLSALARRKALFAVAAPAGFLGILALTGVTFRQIQVWNDNRTLFYYILSVDPWNSLAHHNLGYLLSDEGDYLNAEKHMRTAIQLNPLSARAYNSLGTVLYLEGRYAEAIENYKTALRFDFDQPAGVYKNIGNAQFKMGKVQESIESYREAIQHDPTYWPTYNDLGVALTEAGKYDEAEAALKQGLALNPQSEDIRKKLHLLLKYKERQSNQSG